MTGLEFVVSSVDLILICATVGILAYALVSGVSKNGRPLPLGGIMIVAGMIFAGLAHVSDLAFQYLFPETNLLLALNGGFFSSNWVYWALSRVAFALIAAGLIVTVLARRRIDSDMTSKNALLDDLRTSRSVSDKRFRYLFDSTTDSVYCYSFRTPISIAASVDEHLRKTLDAELVQANDVFVRELETDNVDAVVGQRFGELDSAKDIEAHTALITAFVDSGYRLKEYELNYKTPAGEGRALNVNLIGVVHDGCLERIWGIESNVLEFRETKAELAHRQSYQKLVADVSTKLVTMPDEQADDTIRDCMGRIAEFFDADRSTMLWLDDLETQAVSVANLWTRSGADNIGPGISMKMFPRLWQQMQQRQVIRIDSIADLPDDFALDRRNLMRLDLKSVVVLPLIIANELVGGMSLARFGQEKRWTDQMIADATVFSEILANSVLRLKSRCALADALSGLQNATDRLEAENVYLREEVERKQGFDEIVGESNGVLRCLNQVEQVANTEIPVLILGETGTGKELIARAIHEHSDRRDRPLVKVNCAALPASLIESELFGHEKGAFTGADSRKRGRFDLADGSTLFLDEIGEFPIGLQAKLLRVLQEGEFERLGGTKTIKVDVRLVVATNRDLGAAVDAGEFRSDLYYRINTFPVELPALRDRGADIDLLARHFVNMHAHRLGRDVQEISSEMMRQLRGYNWPGNVRELDGIIQRALISNTGPIVELAEPLVWRDSDDGRPTIISSTVVDLKLVERDHIVGILNDVHWKISGESGAASQLGIPPSTLRSKMKKLGIVRPN